MKKTNRHTATAFRFKRFCRDGYAVFRSMHREVTIGRLATYIADRQMHKSAAALMLALTATFTTAAAQTDRPSDSEPRTLSEVQISVSADTLFGSPEPAALLTAEQIRQSSARTVGDILEMLPGVDVRTRGVGDVQADLSMRGSTFDQMLILLGGINITDPQTGHHNLDIPIDISMVQRVELLSPSQLMARGIVAFCGAVNIVVSDEYRDRLLVDLSAASYSTLSASALVTKTSGRWNLTAAAALHSSDGYMVNTDYRHASLLLHATRHSDRDDWQLQLGGQTKGFGSQAFYSTTYPDQYEATRTLDASVFNLHRLSDATRLETAIYGRLHRDRFELFREGVVDAPSWYAGHNHHISSTSGVRSRLAWRLPIGEALAGAELRHEGICSNVLGLDDPTLRAPYTKSDSRMSTTLFAGYSIHRGRWRAEAVALGLHNSHFGFNYGFTADATFSLRHLDFHASLARTYRLPTFTDLYYQSVTQVANPNLRPESSLSTEAGATLTLPHTALTLAAYYRAGSQIIDWVRADDTELWRSLNHTSVDAFGIDASAVARLGRVGLRASYSFCSIDKSAGILMSQYALEYLRHKACAEVSVRLWKHLLLKGGTQFRLREGYYADAAGNPQPYGSALLVDAAVEYEMRHATFYVRGYNLADSHYRDHGGVPMPGRTLLVGVRIDRNL